DFGYVGVSLGMQGALDKQSPLPGVVWNTTTLGRWHSGYHGFKPELTNKLGLSFWLSSRQSPAVRLSHRRSCDTARVAQQHAFERESWMTSWPLNRDVVVNTSM
ncbi:hypothetical protein, partial [Shewanella algae]|uniref:hypothetical protein n=1 Tax=Shewanella algae TaxID=38313 RepID=UPI001C62A3A6